MRSVQVKTTWVEPPHAQLPDLYMLPCDTIDDVKVALRLRGVMLTLDGYDMPVRGDMCLGNVDLVELEVRKLRITI